MELEKRLLAFSLENPEDTKANSAEKKADTKSEKKELDPQLAERFRILESLADTPEQKKQITDWREKAQKGDQKAIDKIAGTHYENVKIAAESQKKALQLVKESGIVGARQNKAKEMIHKIIESSDGEYRDVNRKIEFLKSYEGFSEYQKKIFDNYQKKKGQRNEMLDAKAGKVSLYTEEERKAAKAEWKDIIEYFKGSDKLNEKDIDTIMDKSLDKLKKEKVDREKVAKEKDSISEALSGIQDAKSEGNDYKLGIGGLLKEFNDAKFDRRKQILDEIKKIVENKKLEFWNGKKFTTETAKGSGAADAVKKYLALSKLCDQGEIDFMASQQKERSNIMTKGWREAYQLNKEKIEQLENLPGSHREVGKWLKVYKEDLKTCETEIEKKVTNSVQNIDEKQTDKQALLKSYQDALKYIDEAPDTLKNKNNVLVRNHKLLTEKIAALGITDTQKQQGVKTEEKPFGDVEEIIKGDTEAENLFMNITALEYEKLRSQSKGEKLEKNATTDGLQQDIVEKTTKDQGEQLSGTEAKQVVDNSKSGKPINDKEYWNAMVQEEDQKALERDGQHIFNQAISGMQNGMKQFEQRPEDIQREKQRQQQPSINPKEKTAEEINQRQGQTPEQRQKPPVKLQEKTVEKVKDAQQSIEELKKKPDAIKKVDHATYLDNSQRILGIKRKREDREVFNRAVDQNERIVNMNTQAGHLDRDKMINEQKRILVSKAKTPDEQRRVEEELNSLRMNTDKQKKAAKMLKRES